MLNCRRQGGCETDFGGLSPGADVRTVVSPRRDPRRRSVGASARSCLGTSPFARTRFGTESTPDKSKFFVRETSALTRTGPWATVSIPRRDQPATGGSKQRGRPVQSQVRTGSPHPPAPRRLRGAGGRRQPLSGAAANLQRGKRDRDQGET